MRIYISGIHSALELDRSVQKAKQKNTSVVICTCKNVLDRIRLLKECDTVFFTDGWESSEFSPLEMSVAEMNNMEILYQGEGNNYNF